MQWYKINLAYKQVQSGEDSHLINKLAQILHSTSDLNFDDIGIFSKVAHNGYLNVYFSQVGYKDLLKYNPIECSAPTNKADEDGVGLSLSLRYGNNELLL